MRLYAGKTHSINHWRKPKPTPLGCWILLKESASGSAPDYRASKRNLHSGDVMLVKLHTPVASCSCQFPLPCLNLSVHSPIHLVMNQSTRHAVIQPVTQPVSRSTTQPVNQTSRSLNQSITQPINHSTTQPITPPINYSTNQSLNHSANQSLQHLKSKASVNCLPWQLQSRLLAPPGGVQDRNEAQSQRARSDRQMSSRCSAAATFPAAAVQGWRRNACPFRPCRTASLCSSVGNKDTYPTLRCDEWTSRIAYTRKYKFKIRR